MLRLARQTVALCGLAPYREYVFALQDGAYGALEHAGSVTLCASSRQLAGGLAALGLISFIADRLFAALAERTVWWR